MNNLSISAAAKRWNGQLEEYHFLNAEIDHLLESITSKFSALKSGAETGKAMGADLKSLESLRNRRADVEEFMSEIIKSTLG